MKCSAPSALQKRVQVGEPVVAMLMTPSFVR
jgi:hypothetical protein